uniref:Uncharacterized protein n=2 Tax=Aegilops tauschii subsp. strangulata TaxID=200361 RepID=A0A453MCL5_AEGTS
SRLSVLWPRLVSTSPFLPVYSLTNLKPYLASHPQIPSSARSPPLPSPHADPQVRLPPAGLHRRRPLLLPGAAPIRAPRIGAAPAPVAAANPSPRIRRRVRGAQDLLRRGALLRAQPVAMGPHGPARPLGSPGQAQADNTDHQEAAASARVVDKPTGNDGTTGIAGWDEERSDDEALGCNDEQPHDTKRKGPFKKRWRKPVKARSLKSLMMS